MANIYYKTTEKPLIQREVFKAISYIGPRQTSYAAISKIAKCTSSDCRYAILDLLEKGYIERMQTKGYAGATRGYRYAYMPTEAGKNWIETPVKVEEPKEEQDMHGLFE